MSDAIDFIKDVICAPYSFPIGLINSKKALDFCSVTTTKDLDIKDVSDVNRVFTGRIGTGRRDASTFTNYEVLSQAIQNILRRIKTSDQVTISAQNTANIDADFVDVNDLGYSQMLQNLTKKVKGDDGRYYDVSVYACPPSVDQITTINVDKYEDITEEDYEEIFNEIEINVENTLVEQGSDIPSDTRVGVLSSNLVRNQLMADIREKITSATEQNINIIQSLNYRDQYGMCEQKMDEGIPYSTGKKLKQSIEIDVLAKNIIHSSAKIIMNNKVDIHSKTTLTIQRITNYRIIVFSLLWNVIVVYLLLKMMSMFMSYF